jgi:hypothetical protein
VQRAYLASSRALSLAQLLLGLALVVATVARGGGPLAFGVVFGALLGALGAGRLWLARGAGRGGAA